MQVMRRAKNKENHKNETFKHYGIEKAFKNCPQERI